MAQICFTCNTNPCTCGSVYHEADKKQLLDAMYCCAKDLRKRFGLKVDVEIDNIELEHVLTMYDDTPLFDEEIISFISNNNVPLKWKAYIKSLKNKTVSDIHTFILSKNEDDFPMIGLFTFLFHILIDHKEKRPFSHLFMMAAKTLFPRETFIREIIESCSSNYAALIPKFKSIITEESDTLVNEKCIAHVFVEFLTQERQKELTPVKCLDLLYRLMQCSYFGSTVDPDDCINMYTDELFYIDESIYQGIKNIPIDSSLENTRLI